MYFSVRPKIKLLGLRPVRILTGSLYGTLYEIFEQVIALFRHCVVPAPDVLEQPEDVVAFEWILPSRDVESENRNPNLSTPGTFHLS